MVHFLLSCVVQAHHGHFIALLDTDVEMSKPREVGDRKIEEEAYFGKGF